MQSGSNLLHHSNHLSHEYIGLHVLFFFSWYVVFCRIKLGNELLHPKPMMLLTRIEASDLSSLLLVLIELLKVLGTRTNRVLPVHDLFNKTYVALILKKLTVNF